MSSIIEAIFYAISRGVCRAYFDVLSENKKVNLDKTEARPDIEKQLDDYLKEKKQ